MSKDLKVKTIIGGVIIAIVFFGIGMAVGKHSGKRGPAGMMGARGQYGMMGGNFPGGIQGGQGRMTRGGGFAAGEIISSDDKSITIKLQDGGSKTIYISDTTQVMKSTSGSRSDLQTGATVTVMGTSNADGSVAANSVQIRPAGMAAPTGTQGQASEAR